MVKEEIIKLRMKNKNLSEYACKDECAETINHEEEDMRTRFFRDSDRIIYSLSYTRYIDKTQVFTFTENDNVSKRITHVQFVSKIARTIGRALGLNEDLIEAAALGHDLGHPPFGHSGEKALNRISLENNEGIFAHNVQSVRTLMHIENKGLGNNISLQVLDAILCHNGEMLQSTYYPEKKSKEQESSRSEKSLFQDLTIIFEKCILNSQHQMKGRYFYGIWKNDPSGYACPLQQQRYERSELSGRTVPPHGNDDLSFRGEPLRQP